MTPTRLPLLLLTLTLASPALAQGRLLERKLNSELQLTPGRLVHQAKVRRYHYHVPPQARAGQALPVLFVLHGGLGTGPLQAKVTQFTRLADAEGFLVVFPDSVEHGRNNRQWNDGREGFLGQGDPSKTDDVGFFRELFDRVVEAHGADPKRIYLTGHSNGSMMSQRLAIELSERIAAIAVVQGHLPQPLRGEIPQRPMPFLLITGTADPHNPYQGGTTPVLGGGTLLSAQENVRYWVDRNGGTPRTVTTPLPDLDPEDGTTVEKTEVLGLNAPVVLYTVQGGGHIWPGTEAQALPGSGSRNNDIDASRVVWDFVSKHTR